MELSDIEVASMTMSEPDLRALLESQGHTKIETEIHGGEPKKEEETPVTEVIPEKTEATEGAAAEQTPVVEATPPVAVEDTDEEKARKKQSGSARLKARLMDRDAEIAALKAELAGKAPLKPAEEKAPAAATPSSAAPQVNDEKIPDAKPKPTLEACDNDYEKFQEELVDWKLGERDRKSQIEAVEQRKATEAARAAKERADAKQAQDAMAAEEQEINKHWGEEMASAKEAYADWDTVVNKQHDKPITNAVMEYVIKRHFSADVVYWIGQHPEEAHRIFNLTVLKEGATSQDKERKLLIAYDELKDIDSLIAAGQESGEETTETVKKEEPAKQAPAPVTAPPVKKKVEFTPKPAPHTPVGTRSAPPQVSLADAGALKKMDPDDYRRLRESQILR